jgi:hypothetical protein
MDDILCSPTIPDYGIDDSVSSRTGKPRHSSKGRPQRRPSNRDEFDGPHQFLARPPPDYVAMQERELPHLPTNLLVQEQDSVLARVNDRLSQCAFDFVAKYQFPIPLTQDMRPVSLSQPQNIRPCPRVTRHSCELSIVLCMSLRVTNRMLGRASPGPRMDRVGVPPETPGNEEAHSSTCSLQRTNQAICHNLGELARNEACRQASVEATEGRP